MSKKVNQAHSACFEGKNCEKGRFLHHRIRTRLISRHKRIFEKSAFESIMVDVGSHQRSMKQEVI
jgi:hypothetical protein